MEEFHSFLLSVRGRGFYYQKVYLKEPYCCAPVPYKAEWGRTQLYGSRPLKSTGRHGHFLNSTGRQGLFLKSTGDMENK